MTRQESERKLNELRKKYIALISSMNFAKAQKIKNKIDSLERELEPHSLGELLQDYTPEFKVEMLRKMHKLFISIQTYLRVRHWSSSLNLNQTE